MILSPRLVSTSRILALAVAAWLPLSPTTAHAETADAVLSRMDAAAKDFKSLSATMKRKQFTAVLSETTDSAGAVRLKKQAKSGTSGVVEFNEPDPKTVFLNGKTLQVFYPKANTVEIYDTSKYGNNIDQFLLLGFGTTAAELNKNYDVKATGTEAISGVQTTKLELVPKTGELKKLIAKIELWIPEGQANPVREKVTEPSRNYQIVDYSDLKVNPALPDSSFELKLPSGVKKIFPQK
jgi:outer membrane lipoprotein-sorting protein